MLRVFVRDASHPLKIYLMRPFAGRALSTEQEILNQNLSRVRHLVECAFGITATKWRVFETEMKIRSDKYDLIVNCIY